MDQTYLYLKFRTEFGKQYFFQDRGPEIYENLKPNPKLQSHYMLLNPVERPTQVTPDLTYSSCNTITSDIVTIGINHCEGGWPKEVSILDEESSNRYRKKCLKEETYVNCLMRLNKEVEKNISANNAVDLYQLYFNEMPPMKPKDVNKIKTLNVYKDPRRVPLPVVSLNWTIDYSKIVAGHANRTYNTDLKQANTCYIWDVENPTFPVLNLTAPTEIFTMEPNPKDVNSIICGMKSGQVGVFDLRADTMPSLISAPYTAHFSPVSHMLFINSKTNSEFFSGSSDGFVKWWDFRFLEQPTDTLMMDPPSKGYVDEQDVNRALGVSSLEFDPKIPTKFFCGTEQGQVISCNRKGKTVQEKFSSILEYPLMIKNNHLKIPGHSFISDVASHCHVTTGPVSRIEKNRGVSKMFLTVGEWKTHIWSEDFKDSSIFWTYPHIHKIGDAVWSPTRFSLFVTAVGDGSIYFWDLLKRHTVPITKAQLSTSPMTKIAVNDTGNYFMAGSEHGSIHLVSVSDNLATSTLAEKNLLVDMFERECKRERTLAMLRQQALLARPGNAPLEEEFDKNSFGVVTMNDEDLKFAEDDYLNAVEKDYKPPPKKKN